MTTRSRDHAVIAIVGAGPRGTSVLERLIANAPDRAPLTVEVVDPFPAGSGATWRTDQHPSLLMNTTAGTATVYTDDTVPMDGPVVVGPTMLEWARSSAPIRDDHLADELRSLDAGTSPSRRAHGHYLDAAFARIVAAARTRGIGVRVHRSRATDIREQGDRQVIHLVDGTRIAADAVVLCLGHIDASTRGRRTDRVIAPGVIVDQDVDTLSPGEDVIVRGTGLGLYDLIALVSHARGGRFEQTDAGSLRYRPSGREPRLWVGSRRGYPFRAKPQRTDGQPWSFPSPSTRTLSELQSRRGGLSFRHDLWPRIAAGAAATYVSVAGGSADDLALCLAALDDLDLVPEALDVLTRTGTGDYHPERTGDPLCGLVFADTDALTAHVSRSLHDDLAESHRGLASAAKAADFAIGASRRWLHPLTIDGGLTPASQREDLDGWFDGYANSLAGGPPPGRAAELAALVDAGVVRFLGAGVTVRSHAGGFLAGSSSVPEASIPATAVIDARLAVFDVATSDDPLISNLRSRGEIRSHRHESPTDSYEDGRIAVGRETRAMLDATGRAHPRRFAIGVPVGGSGNASFTAMARTSSPFLAETDAVARTALAALGIGCARSAAA